MKLLFDQNLSPRLVAILSDAFPDSAHVEAAGLATAGDNAVWSYARINGFTVVSKDGDFGEMSVMLGFPPKVIWLQLGNCTTRKVEAALRFHCLEIGAFEANSAVGIFVVRG